MYIAATEEGTQHNGLGALDDTTKWSGSKSLSLDFRRECRFTQSDEAVVVNFIATSNAVGELHFYLYETSSNSGIVLHQVRKCVLAASRNPTITAISLTIDLTNTNIGKLNDILTIGAGKVKKVAFVHCAERLEIDEMGLINATIAYSLPNLETIVLRLPHEEYLLDLLTRLPRRENPSLKELELTYCEHRGRRYMYTTTLLGIDSFLRSPCARSLTNMSIILEESTTAMWERLVSGLTHASIPSFRLETRRVPPREGIDLLAGYLRHSSSLTKLDIGNKSGDVYFQDVILSALCSNMCLRELYLKCGFYYLREGQGVSISDLLMRNSYLELLSWENDEQESEQMFGPNAVMTNSWIASTSNGLHQNSTLRTLSYINFSSRKSNIGPLFDAISSPSSGSGLEDLRVYTNELTEGCAQVVASAIAKSDFGLKKLTLLADPQDAEFLNIISAVAESSSLSHLNVSANSPLRENTWKGVASVLPKLSLVSLVFEPFFDEHGESKSATKRINQALMKGMSLNRSLEEVDLRRDCASFQSALKEYCNRNLSDKAGSALMSGRLSSSSVPYILRALHSRCETTEEYDKVASTVVFSTLRSLCPVVHLGTA